MNTNSKLCNFLAENKELIDDYDEDNRPIPGLEEINIKKEGPLAIFNYGIGADFTNPIVQEARGIIINLETLDVVCWPFRKFGKYTESYADKIDWSTARAQEKVDGSIIKLWFNKITNEWQFSTNSCINAKEAFIKCNEITYSFYDLIISSSNFSDIKFDILNKDYTYIFELTTNLNRVVVKYQSNSITHIGTRDNITGKEYNLDIGIKKPISCKVSTLDDVLKLISEFDNEKDKVFEGFVVVDANWNRIKVKTLTYLLIHGIVSGDKITIKTFLTLKRNDKIDIDYICKEFPDLAHILRYYDWQYEEVIYNIKAMINITKTLHKKFNGNRKEVANRIKYNTYSGFGFKYLNCLERDPEDFISSLDDRTLTKFIKPYENDANFKECFENL